MIPLASIINAKKREGMLGSSKSTVELNVEGVIADLSNKKQELLDAIKTRDWDLADFIAMRLIENNKLLLYYITQF
jgi:hypothetical protein